MKTRLLIVSAFFILASSGLLAQGGMGIFGGMNFQNLNGKDSDGDNLTNEIKPGVFAGVNYQMSIAPEFYFQPGLLFSLKGAKTSTSTIKLSYIELPLNFVYKGSLGNGYVLVGFGPYFAYKIGNEEVTEYGVLKSFDAGGNVFAGYEMAGGLFFELNTEFGMIKINPDSGVSGDKTAVKNNGFGLALGYRF